MAYNSAYTGPQVDEAVGAVRAKASTWDDKQDKLSGTEDQIVGFNSAGEAVPVAAPNPLPSGGTAGQVLTKTEDGEAWQDAPDGLPEGGTDGQILAKTSDGVAWEDKPLGSPARMNILETICENVELADYGAVYTFPTPIEIDSDAIYLLRYSYKEVYEGETYEYGQYAYTSKVNKDDSSVPWLSGNISMTATNVTDNNLWDGATSNISIYKVAIEVTDPITYVALHSGNESLISGNHGHAEGNSTIASGNMAHAEGNSTTASGDSSHAEGNSTTASGGSSHAEGSNSKATNGYAHAEGQNTTASGYISHAEGKDTTASGEASHAEGSRTIASSSWSHAEGRSTIAASRYQHVQGRCNIEDSSDTYAHIVGNGEDDDNRSNAHTLDWDGNAWFAGEVYAGGTSQSDGHKLMHEPTGGTPGQMLYQGESGAEWGDKPVMYVTITGNDDTGFTVDKTAKEILGFINDGFFVVAKCSDGQENSSYFYAPMVQKYVVGSTGEESYISLLFCSFVDGSILVASHVYAPGFEEAYFNITSILSSNVTFAPGTTGLTSDNVQDAIEEVNDKVVESTSTTITLTTSGWTGSAAPYSQQVSCSIVAADTAVVAVDVDTPGTDADADAEAINAWALCTQQNPTQGAGTLTFYCTEKPTINIPVKVGVS